jgi:acetoin utilization deacetylase AcuC-like enzyme
VDTDNKKLIKLFIFMYKYTVSNIFQPHNHNLMYTKRQKIVVYTLPNQELLWITNNKPELRQSTILSELSRDNSFNIINNAGNLVLTWKMIEEFNTHSPDMLELIRDGYDNYVLNGSDRDHQLSIDLQVGLIPAVFRPNAPVTKKIPLWKRVGLYATDSITPINSGTAISCLLSGNDALLAARQLALGNADLVYSLNCYPGHHAGYNFFGGYCYVNNVMIAARELSNTFKSVAILDVDYHAGDGTSDIVHRFDNINHFSINADPAFDYPHYTGFADDTEFFNFGRKASNTEYMGVLTDVIQRISKTNPDVLIIAFGGDTYKDDPETHDDFKSRLDITDYKEMGSMISCLQLPTLVVQEGGYNMEYIGKIVHAFLSGFN